MKFEISSNMQPQTRQYVIVKNYVIGESIYAVPTLKSMDDTSFEQVDANGAVVLQLKQEVDKNNNLQQALLASQKASMQSDMQLKQLQQNYMLSQQQLAQSNIQNKNMQQMILQLQKQLAQKGDK
jgi:hypothetical protein